MADSNYTYNTLIAQVIQDFDKIYAALRAKNVKNGDGVAHGGQALSESGSTGIATSKYSSLILGQLFRVADGTSPIVVDTNANGEIVNKAGQAISLYGNGENKNANIVVSGDTVTISGLASAYYSSATSLSFSLSGGGSGSLSEVISVSGTLAGTGPNITLNEGKTKYVVTASEGKVLSSVEIDKGSVTIVDVLGPEAASLTANTSFTDAASILKASGDENSYYKVVLNKSASAVGTIKATNVTATVSAGYINGPITGDIDGADVTHSTTPYQLNALNTEEETVDYFVKKGLASKVAESIVASKVAANVGTVTGTSAAISGENIKVSNAANTYTNSVKISLTATGTTGVTVAEGYYTGTESAKTSVTGVDITGLDAYIPVGTVELVDNADYDDIAHNGDTIFTVGRTAPSAGYTLEFNRKEIKDTLTVNAGYIPAAAGKTNTIEAGSKYYATVAAGSATIKPTFNTNDWTVSGGGDYITSTGNSVDITISGSIAAAVDKFTPGYLKQSTEIAPEATSAFTKTIKVKADTPDLSNSLSIQHTGNVDSLPNPDANVDESLTEIFLTSKTSLTDRDYWTINATATLNALDGYVNTNGENITADSTTYYLPRAVLKYVEGGVDGEDFLQVEKSGYLPSGALLDVVSITGGIDHAAVEVAVKQNTGALNLNYNGNGAKYEVLLGKGTVDAGYISASNGTVSGTLSLAHASATTTAGITNATFDTTVNVTKGNNGYILPIALTGEVTTTVSEGYIKSDDRTVNGEAANKADLTIEDAAKTIEVAAATTKLNDSTINTVVSSTAVSLTDDSSKGYAISAVLDSVANSNKITVATNTAGWIGTDFTQDHEVSVAPKEQYVLKGTAPTVSGEDTAIAINDNFTTDQTGKYTVSFSKQVDALGTVAEGYYHDDAEKAISGKVTVGGSLAIDHGKVVIDSVQATPSVSFSSGVAVVTESGKEQNTSYYTVTPLVSGINVDATVTKGYIKDNATDFVVEATTVSAAGETQLYIKKYSDADDKAVNADGQQYDVYNAKGTAGTFGTGYTEGAAAATYEDELIIKTEDTYSERDIVVRLNPDACGSNVRTQLDLLAARLRGNKVTAY